MAFLKKKKKKNWVGNGKQTIFFFRPKGAELEKPKRLPGLALTVTVVNLPLFALASLAMVMISVLFHWA